MIIGIRYVHVCVVMSGQVVQILSLVVLALASVNAEYKADCTDPCTCNGVSWEGKFTYP